jgi:hypothetical protein
MNFFDTEHLKGQVVISSRDKNGAITTLVDDKNLIVLNGRNLLAMGLITGVCPAINNIVFGTGGTIAGSASQVIAVQSTEISVLSPIPNLSIGTDFIFSIDSSAISNISSTVNPQIVYNILIPESTALNNVGINEMALMFNTVPSTAFAIKRFSTITKSSSISISISWTLYF